MGFLPTGLPRLDHAHAGIEACLRDLRRAMQERDVVSARGWSCLLVQKLGDHFSEEERLMRNHGWRKASIHADSHARLLASFARFEGRLKVAGSLTLDLSHLALVHLPELLRVHHITSDFGFAKFAMGETHPRVFAAEFPSARSAAPATPAAAIPQ